MSSLTRNKMKLDYPKLQHVQYKRYRLSISLLVCLEQHTSQQHGFRFYSLFTRHYEYLHGNIFRTSHRDNFRKYLFFSSRSTFLRTFQKALCVHRTDHNFPGNVFSARRTDITIFQEGIFVHRTDTIFSRN